MKSICDGNRDNGGGIHCVCYKCKLVCENNQLKQTHRHRWACDRIGRNELVEHFQRIQEEMIQLSKVEARR